MILELMERLPKPPEDRRSAGLAAVIGFLFGGIGLAIYFKNIVDLIFPVGVVIFAMATIGDAGVVAGGIVTALYGYYRAHLADQQPGAA